MPEIKCHSCDEIFGDYKELALHIMSQPRKMHRKGRRWAAKFLSVRTLPLDKRNRRRNNGFELTEEDKENRIKIIRHLSGARKFVDTVCPKCDNKGGQYLESEFVETPFAWRVGGMLAVMCSGCRRR